MLFCTILLLLLPFPFIFSIESYVVRFPSGARRGVFLFFLPCDYGLDCIFGVIFFIIISWENSVNQPIRCIFPVQLTASRICNNDLTRLIHTLAIYMCYSYIIYMLCDHTVRERRVLIFLLKQKKY